MSEELMLDTEHMIRFIGKAGCRDQMTPYVDFSI